MSLFFVLQIWYNESKLYVKAVGSNSIILSELALWRISSIIKSSLFAFGSKVSFKVKSNKEAVVWYIKALHPFLNSLTKSWVVVPVCLWTNLIKILPCDLDNFFNSSSKAGPNIPACILAALLS